MLLKYIGCFSNRVATDQGVVLRAKLSREKEIKLFHLTKSSERNRVRFYYYIFDEKLFKSVKIHSYDFTEFP